MAAVRFTSEVVSSAGFIYKIHVWDKTSNSSVVEDFSIESGSLVINYDTSGEKKMTEIFASTLVFTWIIEAGSLAANFVAQVRSGTYEEKDIYIWITIGTSSSSNNKVHWSGFMLLDLGDTKDEFYPFSVKIKAVDGLALLKNIDFVPDPIGTSAPYLLNETYGFATNSPSSTSSAGTRYAKVILWIKQILRNASFGGSTQGIADWTIGTSINWYNKKHLAANLVNDPWNITAINGDHFQKVVGQSAMGTDLYEAKNCYDVLLSICRSWGCRCIMYEQKIYFIQIGNYNTPDTGTIASPSNLRQRNYNSNGVLLSTQSHLGDNMFGRYLQDIETSMTIKGGLRKLAGTSWGEYPSIKTVTTSFNSISNFNSYTAFPLIYGTLNNPHVWQANETSTSIQPTTVRKYTQTSLGTYTDAHILSGFYLAVHVQCVNSHSANVLQTFHWAIQAKPSAATTWNSTTGLNYNIVFDTGNTVLMSWEPLKDIVGASEPQGTSGYLDTNYSNSPVSSVTGNAVWYDAFELEATIPPGTSNINIVNPTDMGQINFVATSSLFIGDWDFRIVAAIAPHITNISGGDIPSGHGRIKKIPATTPAWVNPWANINGVSTPSNPGFGTGINVYYNSIAAETGICQFSPVSGGTIGQSQYITQVSQSSSDSYLLKIEDTLWGDLLATDLPSSLLVFNGTAWVYTDWIGEWGRDTVAGVNSFTELLCEEALNIQNVPTQKGNYTLVTSNQNRNLSNNVLYPKYANPIGLIRDNTTGFRYFPIKMERNLETDETKGMWSQMIYNQGGNPNSPNGPIP